MKAIDESRETARTKSAWIANVARRTAVIVADELRPVWGRLIIGLPQADRWKSQAELIRWGYVGLYEVTE